MILTGYNKNIFDSAAEELHRLSASLERKLDDDSACEDFINKEYLIQFNRDVLFQLNKIVSALSSGISDETVLI